LARVKPAALMDKRIDNDQCANMWWNSANMLT
jgi:hypothetical protein